MNCNSLFFCSTSNINKIPLKFYWIYDNLTFKSLHIEIVRAYSSYSEYVKVEVDNLSKNV